MNAHNHVKIASYGLMVIGSLALIGYSIKNWGCDGYPMRSIDRCNIIVAKH